MDKIDPELLPFTTMNEMNDKLSECRQYLNNNYISDGNTALDYILGAQSFIKSADLKRGGAPYSHRIENMLQNTNDKSNTIFKDFENKSEKQMQEFQDSKDKLETFEKELFGNEEEGTEGIKSKIEECHETTLTKHNEIVAYHSKLIGSENESIESQIRQLKEEAEETNNELKEYYDQVFGEESEETGELSGGDKSKFEQLILDMKKWVLMVVHLGC